MKSTESKHNEGRSQGSVGQSEAFRFEASKCGPRSKIGLLCVFIHKVLLEHT